MWNECIRYMYLHICVEGGIALRLTQSLIGSRRGVAVPGDLNVLHELSAPGVHRGGGDGRGVMQLAC